MKKLTTLFLLITTIAFSQGRCGGRNVALRLYKNNGIDKKKKKEIKNAVAFFI
jgi:hypothetical protein